MWFSTEDALSIAATAAAEVTAARERLKRAERHRDALVASFLGQGDMPTGRFATALDLTPARLYQIASREALVPGAGSIFDVLREDPDLAAAFAAAGSPTITPEKRLRVE